MTDAAQQRLLLVHAHPDDESIGTGATMAKYVSMGRGVTLVTCTAGEMGEVLVPELAYLAADQEDRLGEHRRGEIADAMKVLGVTDHRWLGGFGTYRDSGMQWHDEGYAIPADDTHHNAFWNADLGKAADDLVQIIREVKPQVVVTYNPFGGYGHPDHIQAHRVSMLGTALARVAAHRRDLGEAWDVSKLYWTALSQTSIQRAIDTLQAGGEDPGFLSMILMMASPDEDLAARVDAREMTEKKLDALRAYPTQVAADGPFFQRSDALGDGGWGEEYYTLAHGTRGPVGDDGLEADLFAGLV
ncbi:1D-myo-inositol 2-acetamido-2-deoxy-alpha-D-glucopyranoside deacetylase [Nocardioides baekrokdamisoli]|uniref:1D-myo-inositol 2-acetamido-2-deoxy-alpha-D-glucopyranoside deacetylase n=1 Tax=Nocardioides baekrokdamisoli TaxID=1804624 RepID=A0A3G9ICQ1_9ACTN|nr:N-acetyl-1-D-myo-inositol-2-amino-2-deoxy-alpha-D-glucopyranoside deacetylase [Nocardioides baekrokdamisoli]BBH16730.1 1D-myo-inositol 2-acetamido-2-deoxy-alpha-D-glucopyranoside deacetylase [Nocardioides baekrokdamisoli]